MAIAFSALVRMGSRKVSGHFKQLYLFLAMPYVSTALHNTSSSPLRFPPP